MPQEKPPPEPFKQPTTKEMPRPRSALDALRQVKKPLVVMVRSLLRVASFVERIASILPKTLFHRETFLRPAARAFRESLKINRFGPKLF